MPSHKPVQVEVANGRVVRSLGTITAHVQIQGFYGLVQAYVLPDFTPHVGVILGQQWLLQVKALIDYDAMTCTLRLSRKHIVLKGEVDEGTTNTEDGANAEQTHYVVNAIGMLASAATVDERRARQPRKASAREAFRLLRKGAHGLMVQVEPVTGKVRGTDAFRGTWMCSPKAVRAFSADTQVPAEEGHARVADMLKEFSDVFTELPDGLPPERNVGHVINLTPDATP